MSILTDLSPKLLLRVGPAGNSQSFYDEGFKSTEQAFAWQQERFSLDAFEVPFGRGVSMGEDTAERIGQAAGEAGVVLSVHAPYYINLASTEEDKAKRSIQYITDSANLLRTMGGERLVVHVGSPKGQSREEALTACGRRLMMVRQQLKDQGMGDIRLCLETMGRPSVIGTLDEILHLVTLDDSFLPCIDFAHLHAAGGGALNKAEDFAEVLDQIEERIGMERARASHIHFSRIEFGKKGEIRHRIFDETAYGPEFSQLAPLLVQREYNGTIICESRGTMAEDAARIREMLLEAGQSASKYTLHPVE